MYINMYSTFQHNQRSAMKYRCNIVSSLRKYIKILRSNKSTKRVSSDEISVHHCHPIYYHFSNIDGALADMLGNQRRSYCSFVCQRRSSLDTVAPHAIIAYCICMSECVLPLSAMRHELHSKLHAVYAIRCTITSRIPVPDS